MTFLLLLLTLVIRVSSAACPRKCECLWRDSKITVDCSKAGLAAIPDTVESTVQVLNASYNNIPHLPTRVFSRVGLTNLQRVSLDHCALGQVDGHAFHGLANLVELNLAYNSLSEVPSAALNEVDVPSLMTLSLAGNRGIADIGSEAFLGLAFLQKLDLSNCGIESLPPGAFAGLGRLQRLFLNGNSISTLGAQFPPSLHGITLHDNRWTCDCYLRHMRLWLAQSNVPRPIDPVCYSPRRLFGVRINALSLDEFACRPQISPTSMYLTVAEGKNVSLVCRVTSDPESQISWFFNGKLVGDSEDDHIVVREQKVRNRLLLRLCFFTAKSSDKSPLSFTFFSSCTGRKINPDCFRVLARGRYNNENKLCLAGLEER